MNLLFFIFVLFKLFLIKPPVQQSPVAHKIVPSIAYTPSPTPRIVSPMRQKAEYLELVRKSQQGEDIIYSQPVGYSTQLVTWRNWLIYTDNGVDKTGNISTFNFQTGARHTLVKNTNASNLNGIEKIHDEIYITQGGYMVKGALYFADVANNSTRLIGEMRNPRFLKVHDLDIVLEGESDSCWSEGSISRLDPATKTLHPIKSYKNGCYDGDAYIGIDMYDRVIYAAHDRLPMEFMQDDAHTSFYHSLSSISLQNENYVQTLLNSKHMPQGILDIKLSAGGTQVVLLGKSVYIYDLTSQSLQKILSASDGFVYNRFMRWDDRIMCVVFLNQKSNEEIVLSYESKPGGSCTPQLDEETPLDSQYDKMIQKLDLPDNYFTRTVRR